MKKLISKSLKLEIKPLFQFSATETKGPDPTDTVTVTITTTTHGFQKPGNR